LLVCLLAVGCGGGDGGGGGGDDGSSGSNGSADDPAAEWGAAGTGCPVRPSGLAGEEAPSSFHAIVWDHDVSIYLATGDGVDQAFSAAPIFITNQNETVTSSSPTAVNDPLYFELAFATQDLRIEARQVDEVNYSGPRRLCIDGLRGDISAPVGLDAEQAVVYTDILPGSTTSVNSPAEAWIYIKGSGQASLDAESQDADPEIDPSLDFVGSCTGGVCEGTIGSGGDSGAHIYARARGPVHVLRDPR
jgi:hypothetical protein